jgi:hypothetical protein
MLGLLKVSPPYPPKPNEASGLFAVSDHFELIVPAVERITMAI